MTIPHIGSRAASFLSRYFKWKHSACAASMPHCKNTVFLFRWHFSGGGRGNVRWKCWPLMWSRSVELVIQELELAKQRFNVQRMVSLDEVFFLDKEWVREFARAYTKRIGLPFHCQIPPSQIDADAVELLCSMGVQTISIGVESGNEGIRREVYNRRTPDAMLVEKARLLHRHGLFVSYDFIFGNPLEEGGARDALRLLLKMPRPFRLNLYRLQLLPGTRLTEILLEKGLAHPEEVQGHPACATGQFDLGSHSMLLERSAYRYAVNLIYLLGTVTWVAGRLRTWAFSPVPRAVVAFLSRRRWFWINRFGNLIRKHRALWALLGQATARRPHNRVKGLRRNRFAG
jgi:hypothetical protein